MIICLTEHESNPITFASIEIFIPPVTLFLPLQLEMNGHWLLPQPLTSPINGLPLLPTTAGQWLPPQHLLQFPHPNLVMTNSVGPMPLPQRPQIHLHPPQLSKILPCPLLPPQPSKISPCRHLLHLLIHLLRLHLHKPPQFPLHLKLHL